MDGICLIETVFQREDTKPRSHEGVIFFDVRTGKPVRELSAWHISYAMTLTRRWGIRFDALSNHVIGAAIEVHRHLGPGLLESAYELCLAEELRVRGIAFERQVSLPAVYRGRVLDFGYRIDFVIGPIAVEIKAVESVLPGHRAQLLTYLRLKKLPIGLLLNFEVAAL